MEKRCLTCNVILDESNSVKVKNGKYIKRICRTCTNIACVAYDKSRIEKRKAYVYEYVRRIGRIKEYPCETCGKLCYKKFTKAFCCDQCRFLSYVDTSGDCWLWTGCVNRRGYGKFSMFPIKHITSHRASYILFKGSIPDGKCVCHQCDNPRCVKPAHLWIGTTQENTQDMINKGRSLYGEKQNKAKLTDKDVLEIRKLGLEGVTQIKIAEKFNLTPGHVNNILRRRAWLHI